MFYEPGVFNMAKSYLSKKHSPGFIAQVVNNNGDLTGFKIVVPWNSPKSFSLGAVLFNVQQSGSYSSVKHFARATSPLPASWLIDLNAADLAA
jgi:hypothetical protein